MATESTEEHGKSSWEVLIKSLSVIPEQTGIQNINSLDPGLRRGDNLVSVSLMLLFLSVFFRGFRGH